MSSIWLIVVSIVTFFYLFFSLLLIFGLSKKYETNSSRQFSVSILIAARNEAANIQDCLFSLANLEYPRELLEILIIDDRSQDDTRKIVTEFIKDKPCFKYHLINCTNLKLSGKASAISQAIRESTGEIIVITDADCIVPTSWIKKLVTYFSNQTGVVAGFTLLVSGVRIFHRLQQLDLAYLLSVAVGSAGLGKPLSCVGNNFAFRRCVYDQVGGYEGVGFSVTEDFALLKKIVQKTDWNIVFPIDPECLVTSKPVTSWNAFFSQRSRWAAGGKTVHWFGRLLIATSLLTQFLLLAGLYLSPSYFLIGAIFLIILACDFSVLWFPMYHLKATRDMKYLPLYKIFFLLYSIPLLIKVLSNSSITWKGTKYKTDKIIEIDKVTV